MLNVFMLLKTRAMIFFKQTILRICYYYYPEFFHNELSDRNDSEYESFFGISKIYGLTRYSA